MKALSRRALLKSIGAGTALGPFLPLLNASGQEMVFPKRLLLFYSPDGTSSVDHNGMVIDWKPQGTETAFTLHSIHSPLEPFKSKIVIPWGMKMSAGGAGQEHAFGMSGLWSGATLHQPSGDANFDGGNGLRTGWGSGASVDQIIAGRNGPNAPYQRAATDPMQETAYRTLELGAQCAEPHSMHRMIYKGDNQPIHPEINPLAAFNRLFPAGSTTTPPPSAAAQATARKRAQLDALMSQVEKLRGRVGSEEMPKIEAHLSGLRTLSTRLNAPTTTVGCMRPTTAPAASMVKYENSATFRADATAMMDIAVAAFACDLTRIASVQLSRGFSNIVHSWVGATQGHHTISHLSGDNTTQLADIDRWYATQFAYLLGKLDAVKEGNGTMLDNTLVVWGREMGTTSHKMQPVNLILAGGARGALPMGRFLDRNREPHAKLLVSICRLMGISDVNGVGDIAANSGPLAGIG
jgi:uncharacterized protein DUF1552